MYKGEVCVAIWHKEHLQLQTAKISIFSLLKQEKQTKIKNSLRPFPLKQNILKNSDKIPPIGTEGVLQIGLKILSFALLDFFECFWHVNIERGQQSWFCFYPKLLYFFGIQIKILLAQRSNTHQFHLAFQQIDEHGQLVEPSLAKETAPFGNAIIVIEFAAHIQIVVLVNVSLQILRIGVHSPELEHIERFPVLANPPQLYQSTILMVLGAGLTFLLGNHAIAVMDILLANHFKTTIIQSPQHFRTWKHFPYFLCA